MTMIISVEHGAMMLPVNSPVIGSARSAPFADDGVSGPPLFPDQGLPLLVPPQTVVSTRKGRSATTAAAVAVVAVPLDAGDPTDADPSYDEAVEKLLWFLVVG